MRDFKNTDRDEPLTLELCREWLASKVFRLRPADYKKKYPIWPGMVGLELEMMPFAQGSSRLLPLLSGSLSSSQILLDHLPDGWTPEFIDGDPSQGLLRIALDCEDQITFEPGGQVEYSSKPYPCLSDAVKRLYDTQTQMIGMFQKHNVTLTQSGINPWQTVQDIGLQMTKKRYQAMNSFFSTLGPYGQRMMRQTCTVQVNLDFGDTEEILSKRYLAANLLAPLATAIFANSPFVDGKDTGLASFRGRIWRGLDDSRTGFPDLKTLAAKMSLESCIDTYLESLLNARLVFVEGLDYRAMDGKVRFRDWLKQPIDGVKPVLKDLETHLSLHFPEVRPRGFLELRSVDCTPRYWQDVPGIFYTALLYDPKSLDATLDVLLPHLSNMRDLLEKCVHGLKDAQIYELSRRVLELVLEGFSRLPPCFQGTGSEKKLQNYLQLFSLQQRTPADLLRPLLAQGLGPEAFQRLEDSWNRL